MKILLSQLAEQRISQIRSTKEKKLLLAHIVPQIVNGWHAPSRILENLVLNDDRDKFEVIVVSTELLREYPLEYPYNFYTSASSRQRGGERINKFQQIGVKTLFNEEHFLYINNARNVTRLLNEHQVDIAVFHGPDTINTMAA